MIQVILLLLQALTFDPQSVKTIEYRPPDCIHYHEEGRACKQVMLTFSKMIVVRPGQSEREVQMQVNNAEPLQASDGMVDFHFDPTNCKPLHDIRGRYVCWDKHWKKEPPTIWWEPHKSKK